MDLQIFPAIILLSVKIIYKTDMTFPLAINTND